MIGKFTWKWVESSLEQRLCDASIVQCNGDASGVWQKERTKVPRPPRADDPASEGSVSWWHKWDSHHTTKKKKIRQGQDKGQEKETNTRDPINYKRYNTKAMLKELLPSSIESYRTFVSNIQLHFKKDILYVLQLL